ncbi:MAG: hypothetical protein GY793_12105 [Proteobacteria bacterium]|nr:hypothetical protein [Pseudomonadota bacterium]
MDISYGLYLIKKFIINYFDFYRKTARKEFNATLLGYTILLMVFGYFVVDFDLFQEINNYITKSITIPLNEEKITMDEATSLFNNIDLSFIPFTLLSFLPLLLLPLYIRRINDTSLHVAFSAPLVIVYVFNFITTAFKLNITFGLLDAMSVYNFILVTALCVMPSHETEFDGV